MSRHLECEQLNEFMSINSEIVEESYSKKIKTLKTGSTVPTFTIKQKKFKFKINYNPVFKYQRKEKKK